MNLGRKTYSLPWLHMSCELQSCTLQTVERTQRWGACFKICQTALKKTKRERIVRSRCVSMLGTCVCGSALLTWLRCGLTLAESPGVVDVLLAYIAHASLLEALLCEGVAPCFGKLQTHRGVESDHLYNEWIELINVTAWRRSRGGTKWNPWT